MIKLKYALSYDLIRPLIFCLLFISSACTSSTHTNRSEPTVPPSALDVMAVAKSNYEEALEAITMGDEDLARTKLEYALDLLWRSDLQMMPRGNTEERRVLRGEIKQSLADLLVVPLPTPIAKAPPQTTYDDTLFKEEREISPGFAQLTVMDLATPPDSNKDLPQPDFSQFDIPIVMNASVMQALYILRTTAFDTFNEWLNRGNRYYPMIQSIFQKEGLPHDLVSLALIGSGFHPRAVSADQAVGLWQILPPMVKPLNLNRTDWIDERYDPEKSTRAVARHLKMLYGEFGDWVLVMAAHHAGAETIRDMLNSNGNTDFWRMDLPRNTPQFVSYVMAATIISKDPQTYGFNVHALPPVMYETVMLDASMPLQSIAEGSKVSINQLRMLNPELRRWHIPSGGYAVKVPVGSQPQLLAWAGLPTPAADPSDVIFYTVRRGDTILGIARRFRVYANDIIVENEIKRPNRLRAGQSLLIPAYGRRPTTRANAVKKPRKTTNISIPASFEKNPTSATHNKITYRVRRGDTLEAIGKRYRLPPSVIQYWNNINNPRDLMAGKTLTVWLPLTAPTSSPKNPPPGPDGETITYTVRRGDTLWDIARSFNISVASIRATNGLNRRSSIFPGDKLKITRPK